MKVRALCIGALLLGAAPAGAVEAETVVVLVRHAEKVDESRDAALTEGGLLRARALAAMLKDSGIEAVYSTDFRRTRETARPTAELLGRSIELYQGDDLASLAKGLRSRGGRTLVVGHSNTTPELVRLLGGDEGAAIAGDEYDRLYLLVITPHRVTTTILRFSP